MKKLYKYLLDAVVVSTVLACSACASMPVADPAVEGDQPETLEKLLYLLRYLSSQILISRIILKSSVIIVIA